jgi:mRNA interferase RelE/StbE
MYKLELSREAQRFYEQSDKSIAKKLARCFRSLEADPRASNNVKTLKGPSPARIAIALVICV